MTEPSPFEPFRYDLQIRERHLDTFGHVNNATYLQILEDARWEFITPRGFGLHDIQRTGLGPVVLEFNLKFIKELRLRQNVYVESQMISYEKKIGILRQDIFNDANELCFAGKMVFGLMDTKARKLVLPTPEWLKAVGVRPDQYKAA